VDQMKTDMINVIVHELRNRVATISMLSTFFAGHEAIEEGKREELIRLIVKNAEGLNILINRFLDIARLESRRVEYPKQMSDIVSIIRAEMEQQMPQFQAKSLKPELTVSGKIPLFVVVPDLISDAAANLISNAIKYGDEGRTIELSLSRKDESVAFSITDHGYGIPPEAQEKLFTKFYRVAVNQKAAKQVGTGLGLAYVKEIATYHNGSVSLESNPEIGCKFTMTLPIPEEHID